MRDTGWLSRRMTVLFQSLRSSRGMAGLPLPLEILFMIVAYLDTTSIVCLSLTCRKLYSTCFPRNLKIRHRRKERLLLLLEKDTPTLVFCHHCTKLHRWHARWGKLNSLEFTLRFPCEQQELRRHVLGLSLTCYIPYHQARLVMNRHLYGPSHGMPVRTLDRQFRFKSPPYGVTVSENLSARIVDGQLLLLAIQTVFHAKGNANMLRQHVESAGSDVCKHVTMRRANSDYAPEQVPELTTGRDTHRHFTLCEWAFRSCPICLTEYEIKISEDGGKGGLTVKVWAYRQLGKCGSPSDWDWRSMAVLCAKEEPRIMFPEGCELGVVRDRWNKAVGIEGGKPGRWVQVRP